MTWQEHVPFSVSHRMRLTYAPSLSVYSSRIYGKAPRIGERDNVALSNNLLELGFISGHIVNRRM